ncbi:hypothetical protein [Fontivita pretiosa]|uniref:cadherin repeat domain-containing protein n=1 Tax=Fontivita pretiosa TaxID=2989684 RepID=UPI003D16D870
MQPEARAREHGLALMLVLVTVALAALIGYAMLSAASLQTQISDGTSRAAAADCIADSAVHAGIFFLQYPSKTPASWMGHAGYVMYADNVPMPDGNGNFDIDVTASPTTRDRYRIRVTARSGGSTPLTRSATANVQVVRITPSYAGAFGGSVTVPPNYTLNGSVLAGGSVTMAGGTITGSTVISPPPPSFVVPTLADVNHYGAGDVPGQYLMPDGLTVGTPQPVSNPLLAPPAWNSTTNPGRVFYCNGDVRIQASMTFPGTLVVRNGSLVLDITGGTITFTPQPGFPALVIDRELKLNRKPLTVTANGIVWTGSGLQWLGPSSLGSVLTINGALMMPAGAALGSTYSGVLTVNYHADAMSVPDLRVTPQAATSVKILSWN